MAIMRNKIDRYDIYSELGRGTMGIVYRGFDPNINRVIAIKILKIDFLDDEKDEFIARFQREAQSAGNLSHQNIVTIYDLGEDKERKDVYIVMELIDGINLRKYIHENKPLDHESVLSILWQIAKALDYAHIQGIIHRDIKPANILISPTNTVKITDFGIAKIAGSDFTQTGKCLGTPSYMSPEQVIGKNITHKSDIFSVGALAYEMLTGNKAFEGDNITSIVYKILNEHPKIPSSNILFHNRYLVSAIDKCIDKDPSKRYSTVSDFVLDLQNALIRKPDNESAADPTLTINISTRSKEDYEQLLLKLRQRYISGDINKTAYKEMQRDIELDYARDRYVNGEMGEDTYNNAKKEIEREFQKSLPEEKNDAKNNRRIILLPLLLIVLIFYIFYNLRKDEIPDTGFDPSIIIIEEEEIIEDDKDIEDLISTITDYIENDKIPSAIAYLNILREKDPDNININSLEKRINAREREKERERHDLVEMEKSRKQKLLILEISQLLKEAESALDKEDFNKALKLSQRVLEHDNNNEKALEIQELSKSEIRKIEEMQEILDKAGKRREIQVKGITFAIRYCPPGNFIMGSPETEEGRIEDEIQREITISNGFWIMETEVTQELWEAVMILHISRFRGKDLPVTDLGWRFAVDFCNRLSSITGKIWTLPTEAEWEYACRAGTDTPFSFGDQLDFSLANFDGNHPYGGGRKGIYLGRPAPVGSYPPNDWGIYDMHGNVWEWVLDYYDDYIIDDLIDPSGPEEGSYRVIRGGGWYDRSRFLRSAARRYETKPNYGSFIVGFRAVMREDPND